MPDLPTLEQELKDTRQEVRNLQVMQMLPNQSAEKLKVLSDLERSARAEVGEGAGVRGNRAVRSGLRPRPAIRGADFPRATIFAVSGRTTPRRNLMPVYVIAEVDVNQPRGSGEGVLGKKYADSESSRRSLPRCRRQDARAGRGAAETCRSARLEQHGRSQTLVESKASKDLREVGYRYGKFRVFAIEGLEQ
jgi:hypothetical protein